MKNKNKTTTPIVFAFEESAVRIIPNADNPLFVAKDVCDVLGIKNARDAISDLDDDEKITLKRAETGILTVGNTDSQNTRGGSQFTNVVTESGLYALIFKSRKEEAKKFRKWVTSEVLPSIRKTGSYGPASRVYEVNQQHALRLKLLQALDKAENTAMRESIYQSLAEVSKALDLPLLPLDDFHWAGVPASVREQATEVCARFWSAIDALTAEDGVDINHSRDGRFIAVNLAEVIALSKKHEIDMPLRLELLRYLPYSQSPEFIQRKVLASPIKQNRQGKDKTMRCWLFKL